MAWLSITMDIDAARAEALSEALIEAGADSVDLEPLEQGTRITALAARDADPAALLASAARAAGMASPEFRAQPVADDDWVRRSQSQFGPLRVGNRLWIVPSWHTPPGAPALVVRLDPGLAFGTGGHPSTRLILKHLEDLIRRNERVLDYGCGSGVLGIAAAMLGARRIDAADVDATALRIARENARRNGIALRACLPEELPGGTYDLVLANILAGPLVELAASLAGRTRSGGRLLLSGILQAQAQEVIDAYQEQFFMKTAANEDGWALLEGTRRCA